MIDDQLLIPRSCGYTEFYNKHSGTIFVAKLDPSEFIGYIKCDEIDKPDCIWSFHIRSRFCYIANDSKIDLVSLDDLFAFLKDKYPQLFEWILWNRDILGII